MRKMTETETMNTNGGLLGWIAIGIGAAIIVAGGIKAYNDPAMEDVNDALQIHLENLFRLKHANNY